MKKSQTNSKVKAFFQKLYWLPPLLLVAIVFILVFSLQGFSGAIETMKGWFNPNSTCKTCEIKNVEKVENYITGKVDGGEDVVYIYYYDKDCAACTKANAALNIFVKAYNSDLKEAGKDKVALFGVNYGVKEYNKVETNVPEKFRDTTMTVELYNTISLQVRNFYLEVKPGEVENIAVEDYKISTPTLVRYTKNADNSYSVDSLLTGNTSTVTNYFNQTTLKQLFDGNYTVE